MSQPWTLPSSPISMGNCLLGMIISGSCLGSCPRLPPLLGCVLWGNERKRTTEAERSSFPERRRSAEELPIAGFHTDAPDFAGWRSFPLGPARLPPVASVALSVCAVRAGICLGSEALTEGPVSPGVQACREGRAQGRGPTARGLLASQAPRRRQVRSSVRSREESTRSQWPDASLPGLLREERPRHSWLGQAQQPGPLAPSRAIP